MSLKGVHLNLKTQHHKLIGSNIFQCNLIFNTKTRSRFRKSTTFGASVLTLSTKTIMKVKHLFLPMVSLCLVTTSCKNSTQQTEPEVVSTNVKSELTSSSSETSSTLNTILSSNLYSVIQASETSSPNLVLIRKAPRLETTATTSPFNPDSMVISLSTITGTYEFCKKDSIPFI